MENCPIAGVVVRPIRVHVDARGWLAELYREDDLPGGFAPAMGYVSVTHAGVARGPHEHARQTDGFCFLAGAFRLTLWENRPGEPPQRWSAEVGEADPVFVSVPPGVVHAYENVGDADAYVLNFPDALYAGRGRAEPVDEVRHEDTDSPFRL